MPSAPKRQAAARAARNIHHQYSTPFVPLPYHACDDRSTAGRYEEDPSFKAGGYLYRSYANQMPDAFGQPSPNSRTGGSTELTNPILSSKNRKEEVRGEAKLRTSSFPYDQYLVGLYDSSPKKPGRNLSPLIDDMEPVDLKEDPRISSSPREADDWLLSSPSRSIKPEYARSEPGSPASSPIKSAHNALVGSSSLTEPSASPPTNSTRAAMSPARVRTPLIRPSQLAAHTPPGSPLQWWADLTQLPIPEEAREDDITNESVDNESAGLKGNASGNQSDEHEHDFDRSVVGVTIAPPPKISLAEWLSKRQSIPIPKKCDLASSAPIPTTPPLRPISKRAQSQRNGAPSIKAKQGGALGTPFRPRSAAFQRVGPHLARITHVEPQVSPVLRMGPEDEVQLVNICQAWSALTRAYERMKEVMVGIGHIAP